MEERSFYLFSFIPFNRVDFFVYMINFLAVIFPLSVLCIILCSVILFFYFSLSKIEVVSKEADLKSFLLQN